VESVGGLKNERGAGPFHSLISPSVTVRRSFILPTTEYRPQEQRSFTPTSKEETPTGGYTLPEESQSQVWSQTFDLRFRANCSEMEEAVWASRGTRY